MNALYGLIDGIRTLGFLPAWTAYAATGVATNAALLIRDAAAAVMTTHHDG